MGSDSGTVGAAPGWYADPLGRHRHRYWDGAAWTHHVATDGRQSTDPLDAVPAPADTVPADEQFWDTVVWTETPRAVEAAKPLPLPAPLPMPAPMSAPARATADATPHAGPAARPDRLAAWQWVVLVLFSPLAGFVGWLVWRPAQPRKARRAAVVAWVVLALQFVLFVYPGPLTAAFIVERLAVPVASMAPTIQPGDGVLVNKSIYRFGEPQPGDVVVFEDPTGDGRILVKRVIAVGGDTVAFEGGAVVVDGETLDELYTQGAPSEPLEGSSISYPATVPDGGLWVMGDNRPNSMDSRWFGPVPVGSVQGKVFMIYSPLSRLGAVAGP